MDEYLTALVEHGAVASAELKERLMIIEQPMRSSGMTSGARQLGDH